MNSLERSLQLGLLVSLTLLMLMFWWAGSLTSRLLTESFVQNRLRDEADSLVASLEFPSLELDQVRLGPARLNPAYDEPASGKYFKLHLLSGEQLQSRSAWDQPFNVPELAPGQSQRRREAGISGEPLLIWLGGFSKEGRAFTVAVAENFAPIEARLLVFKWYFAAISLLLLIALLVVQHLIVRRSVEKLDAIRGDIKRLEHGQIVSLSEDVPSEIMPLVREFNRLLLRFDQRLKVSRNAAGNLAHALKGPLNLLLRSSESATDDVAQNAERIRQVIESELKRARLAGRSAVGQRLELDRELPALIGLLEQVYSEKTVDIRYSIGPEVELVHDRQDMLELIGNLLDNAVKWSATVVLLNIRSASGVLLEVEDDGPGCSPEIIGQLTRRGVRLDESKSGHGLGLSIVKDIVDNYEGSLDIGHSNRLGGLRVTVHLPDDHGSNSMTGLSRLAR